MGKAIKQVAGEIDPKVSQWLAWSSLAAASFAVLEAQAIRSQGDQRFKVQGSHATLSHLMRKTTGRWAGGTHRTLGAVGFAAALGWLYYHVIIEEA